MVILPKAMLKYSSAAIVPVPPRPRYRPLRAGELTGAMAAASTPSTIAICAPATEPRPTARKVLAEDVRLGR